MRKKFESAKKQLTVAAICGCIALSPAIAIGAKEATGADGNNSTAGTATATAGNGSQSAQGQSSQNQQQSANTTQTQNAVKNQEQNQAAGDTQTQNREQQQTNTGEGQNQNKASGNSDDNGNGVQNQERAQVQTEEKAKLGMTKEEKNQRREQRQSQVANAIQNMERIAENNQGIGEQVRVIAQEQNRNQESAEDSLKKSQDRNGVLKLLIGANYGQLKKAKDTLSEQDTKIQEMERISAQIQNSGDQQLLMEQIRIMEQVREETINEIANEENQFSLFGWVFKWFAK